MRKYYNTIIQWSLQYIGNLSETITSHLLGWLCPLHLSSNWTLTEYCTLHMEATCLYSLVSRDALKLHEVSNNSSQETSSCFRASAPGSSRSVHTSIYGWFYVLIINFSRKTFLDCSFLNSQRRCVVDR